MLGNTMSVIASDLQQATVDMGGKFDAGALDYYDMHGDFAAAEKFADLPYKEQLKIAKRVAKYYI